jgi:hypothetical protein
VALEAFFDGSHEGGWTEGKVVTLAGFAAEDSIWLEVNQRWDEILKNNTARPVAKYLHMKEAAHLQGDFTWRNGWNHKKVETLVLDFLMYLQHVDKERFRMFWCTVDLEAYRRLKDEGLDLADPLDILIDLPKTVLSWFCVKWPGVIDSAYFFFDRGEPFKGPFEQRWKKEKSFSLKGTDYFWSLLKTVTTVDMRDKPGLQAADLLAWAVNRSRLPRDASFKLAQMIMTTIIPSAHIVWDEKKLREKLGRIDP